MTMSERRIHRETMTPREMAAEELVGAGPSTTASPPESTGETVTVACNIPNGLLLRLFEMVEIDEATPGGSRKVKQARVKVDAGQVVINGSAVAYEDLGRSRVADFRAEHGYALTVGVAKDFWEAWLEQNKTAPYVKNHCIFAIASTAAARRKVATEMSNMRSGLEAIDPDDPTSKSPELRGLNMLSRGNSSGAGPIERGERS